MNRTTLILLLSLSFLGCKEKDHAPTSPHARDTRVLPGEDQPQAEEGPHHDDHASDEQGCGCDHAPPTSHARDTRVLPGEDQPQAEEGPHHDHHGHGHEELPLDELDSRRCEHDMPQVACAECRYELGVVEVPAEVARELLTETAAMARTESTRELSLRCETGVNEQQAVQVVALAGGRVEEIRTSLGATVRRGDVLAVLASDEFSRIKLSHEKAHQERVLARTRFDRLVRVQENLNQLLDRLRAVGTEGIDVEAISKLEIGLAKAELMAAANGFLRARTDWQRDERRVDDGRKLIEKVRGRGDHDLDTLVVGSWKADLLAARADLRLAHQAWSRLKELGGKGLASRKEQDQARRDLDVANARFDAAVEQVTLDIDRHRAAALERLNTARSRLESAVEQAVLDLDVQRLEAQQALDRAETGVAVSHRRLELFGFSGEEVENLASRESDRFGRLEVRAPAAGIVLEQHLAIGQVVDQGQPLFRIADLSRLWTWCHVYEKDLAVVAESDFPLPAKVEVEAFPGRVFTGSLDYLARETDEHSRTVRARVVTENPRGLLRPNMFVHAAVQVAGPGEGIVVVPASAVVSDGHEDFVFLHWRENTWVKRTVTVASRDGAQAVLKAGLSPGDKVAVRGAFFLKSDVLREKMGAGCAH